MAAKSLPHFKSIFTFYLFHSEHVCCPRLSILKRDVHIRKGFLDSIKKFRFSRTFKFLAGIGCLTLGSYLIGFIIEEESDKKARQLKLAGLRKSCNFISDVVEVASDAVVHITMQEKQLFFSNIKGGSGFIINSDGLIVTNAHVVGNQYGRNVQVTLRNGRTFVGVVKDVDEVIDLALICINGKNLPVLKLGSAVDLRAGEWVAAIGSPFFLSNSVTAGVVSSVHRRAAELGIPNRNINYIQTDTTVVSGNSGGPLVNLDGEVVGVNTMTVTAGISFAIPVEYVKNFVKRYNDKSSRTGKNKFYVGFSYLQLNPTNLRQLLSTGVQLPGIIQNGMYIWKVEPNSPASKCGLQAGDIIYEVDGGIIYDLKSLYDIFEKKDSVTIKFYRNGLHYKTTLTPRKEF